MKKQSFLTLIILANSLVTVLAQTTLPLIQGTGGSTSASSASVREAKLQRALVVYQRLVAARGDSRYPVPTLTLGTSERNGAIMYYNVPEIMLEEKAYDVCAGFKEDMDIALAALLGHELTHYYEKHGWRRGFVSDYADMKINMKLDSLQEKVGYETQADYLGGFLAYTAGYGAFDKGPQLIQAIYDAYHLEDARMPDYPPREDRKELSKRTALMVKNLIDVFDMANLLTIVGLYPEAKQYYKYILKEYQSREIYNNLGVLTIMEAQAYFKADEFKFQLPLELDLQSSGSKAGPAEIEARQKLLNEALRYFDSAISLDPDYAPAYLNKACAYTLLNDLPRAQFYAGVEAVQRASKKSPETLSDAKVLLGILAALQGDHAQAQKILEAENANKNVFAETNLAILLQQEPKAKRALDKPESIDDIDLDRYMEAPGSISEIRIGDGLSFHQDLPDRTNSRIYMTTQGSFRPSVFFHLTEAKYKGKSARNVSIGDDRSAVEQAYGLAQRVLKTPMGAILRYGKVIFLLDLNGKVTRWVNYLKP